MQTRYNPTTKLIMDDDTESSVQLHQSSQDDVHDQQSRRPSSLLFSNYLPKGHSYLSSTQPGPHQPTGKTSHFVDRQNTVEVGQNELDQQRQRRRRRRSSSFGQYISHALAMGSKTNYLFACILFFNLLMSIMNTILLSLVVKSVQMSDLTLLTSSGGRAFEWNPLLEGIELHLPVSPSTTTLGETKPSLFVQSIESLENKPLIISSTTREEPTNQQDAGACGQIVIAASRAAAAAGDTEDQMGEQTTNRIVIEPNGHVGTDEATSDAERVEIVTNNLVLDQLPRHQAAATTTKTAAQKLADTTSGSQQRQLRLLEFDGEQQLIALPATNQLKLFPVKASALTVNAELRGQQSELSGTLGEDFDIQTRHGNLTCESRQALRLISRSARLNLVARQALVLGAPQLRLEAKRLHMAEGIEYLELPPHNKRREAETKGASASSAHVGSSEPANRLQAYNLVLIDGQLMAAAGPTVTTNEATIVDDNLR